MISTVTTAARGGMAGRVEGFAREGRPRRQDSVTTLSRRVPDEPADSAVEEAAERIAADPSMVARLWLVVDDPLGRALARRMDIEICRAAADARIAGARIAAG